MKGKDHVDSKRDLPTSFTDGDAMSLKAEKINCLAIIFFLHSGYKKHDDKEPKRNSALVNGYNVNENVSVGNRALSAREGEVRDFMKPQLLLQRKCHLKIALCSNLGGVRLFYVGHMMSKPRVALKCRFNPNLMLLNVLFE